MHRLFPGFALLLALALASCAPAPAVDPPPPTLRRLTTAQYGHAVADLFGADVAVPAQLEPDVELEGFFSVGAAQAATSPRGVELYEEAAYAIAEQALDADHRAALVPCTPSSPTDADCAAAALAPLARRAWGRPPGEDDVATLVALSTGAGAVLDDFFDGLAYGVAAILQSPRFLYRHEQAEPADGGLRFDGWTMAARLSFLFWNTIPDEELLRAAGAGELTTDEGLSAQAERLLADPRARDGLRAFVTELYRLHALDHLSKDPTVFTQMSDAIGPAAREETLRLWEDLVFEQDGDYRELLTTRKAFLDRKLASLYDVPAPAPEGFAATTLPEDGARRGLLGNLSVLALQAHPINSSPTRRGAFIRTRLLCHPIPSPPAGVDTSIPEPSGDTPTLRDRVDEHLQDPACAGCHRITDPVGLGMENFDALGRFRTHDNGVLIDASGELDGASFEDFPGLAEAVSKHEDLPGCLAKQAFRYASGHREVPGEGEALGALGSAFAAADHRVRDLLMDLVLSPAFRETAAVDPAEPEDAR